MDPIIPYFQTILFNIPMPGFMPMDHVTVYGFGICVAIGVIAGRILVGRRAARQGIDPQLINEGFLWVVIGVIVGGHIGYGLFYHPKEYFANPMLFLDVTAGLSSFGGFIFVVIALAILLRKYKQPVLPFADSVTIAFTLGWFFGRMGCTINHEHPGTATRFFLGRYCRPVEGHTWQWPDWMTPQLHDLRFSHCIERGMPPVTDYAQKVTTDYPGVIAVHDMGFYEAIYALCAFVLFTFLDRKPRRDGFYAALLVLTYAPVRFAMDFLRPLEGNVRYAGLTPAQWGCIVFLIACVVLWKRLSKANSNSATA